MDFLTRCGKEFGHKQIRDCGLSDTEFFLCSYVYFNPECTQDEVVTGTNLDKTTAAKAFSALEKRDIVFRYPDESDKRRKIISLTWSGSKIISEIIDIHDEWMGKVMSVLTSDEQELFEKYCIRLMNAAKQLRKQ